MTEWKEYNGSDEQIAEMRTHKAGYILRFKDGRESGISNDYFIQDIEKLFCIATHYLLCNPHANAKMASKQILTGQPVWVKVNEDYIDMRIGLIGSTCTIEPSPKGSCIIKTTTPNWNIPNAEYSFAEFKEEV